MYRGRNPGATGLLLPSAGQLLAIVTGWLYVDPGSVPLASIMVLSSRKVFHTAGTNAPLAVAPSEEFGSGWPITPPEFDESAGQSRATKVCQPKFSQSFWVGFCPTSTGTRDALEATAALDF